MKIKKIIAVLILFPSISLMALQPDSTEIDSLQKPPVQKESLNPDIIQSKLFYYSQSNRYIFVKNLPGLIKLDDADILKMAEFSKSEFKEEQESLALSDKAIIKRKPKLFKTHFDFVESFQNKAGLYIFIGGKDIAIQLSEYNIRKMLVFADNAYKNWDLMEEGLTKKVLKELEQIDKTIKKSRQSNKISKSTNLIDSDVQGFFLGENKRPFLYVKEPNIVIPLVRDEIASMHKVLLKNYRAIKKDLANAARLAVENNVPVIQTNIQFMPMENNTRGIYLDSLNLFIPISDNGIRRMYGFAFKESKSISNQSPKLAVKPKSDKITINNVPIKQDSVAPVIQPVVQAKPQIQIPKTAGVVNSDMTFFKSFQGHGGPHIYIESQNIAVPVSVDKLEEMMKFCREELLKVKPSALAGFTDADKNLKIRYYSTDYTAKDLIKKQIFLEEAANTRHFKAVLDENNRIVSFEYLGGKKDFGTVGEKLTKSKGGIFNLFFNKVINYENNKEQKVAIYKDSTGKPRAIKYMNNKGKTIARGRFYYGLNDNILEQRIEFLADMALSEIHPFYFNKEFNLVKKDWIVKCLYSEDKKLSKIIVMDDSGNQFYSYNFVFEEKANSVKIVSKIYDIDNKLAVNYALLFSKAGTLRAKLFYDENQKKTGYLTFEFGSNGTELLVQSFGPKGNLISKYYQDL